MVREKRIKVSALSANRTKRIHGDSHDTFKGQNCDWLPLNFKVYRRPVLKEETDARLEKEMSGLAFILTLPNISII